MPIRRLSVQLANQIAAGEVVERPSSVVKELLENAVDAKATRIICDLINSGKSLIRVRDNGLGIEHEELPLALAPHATSKISTIDDLNAILTLGFRGEALASIAAVSKLTLTSRTKDDGHAYSVQVEGPEQNPEINPAAHPVGTSVEVRELFFNTPARRRFLRSDRTEFMHIREIFIRTALANPDIDFELNCDGKNIINVKAVNGDERRSLQRLSKLVGNDFTKEGISLDITDPCLNIKGVLLPPPLITESAVESIFLFLNGRPIADKVLTHALKQAYSEVALRACQVRCVLYLSCDPHEVDINVHPRKDEVRFHESRLVHDVLLDNVVNTLRRNLDIKKETGTEPSQPLLDKSDSNDAIASFLKPTSTAFKRTISNNSPESCVPHSYAGESKHTSSAPLFLDNVSAGTIAQGVKRYDYQLSSSNAQSRAHLSTPERIDLSAPKKVKLIAIPSPDILFIAQDNRYFLVKASALCKELKSLEYMQAVKLGTVPTYTLTLPFALKVNTSLIKALKQCPEAVARAGFCFNFKKESIEMIKVPLLLKGMDLAGILAKALPFIAAAAENLKLGICPKQLALVLSEIKNGFVYHQEEAVALINKLNDISILEELGADSFEVRIASWAREMGGLNG